MSRGVSLGAAALWAVSLAGCSGSTQTVTVPKQDPDVDAARQFTAYPLYWVGERFEGVSLTQVSIDKSNVTFIYGTCTLTLPADGGCGPTLQIQIWPRCIELAAAESGLRIRGAPLNYSYGGDPLLNTNRVEVRVFTGEGSTWGMKFRALRALRSANKVAPIIDADDPIPAPPRKRSAPCSA